MAGDFDFIQSYRDLDGSSTREIVDARHNSFQKLSQTLSKKSQIYDLCWLAYQIEPFPRCDWFESAVREFDPHFILTKDKVDAGRMAALLLRQKMTPGESRLALAILTASFCGRRHSADGDALTKQANTVFHEAARQQQISNGVKLLAAAPKLKAITTELEAINTPNAVAGTAVKTVFEATMVSAEAAMKVVFDNFKVSLSSARSDVSRLAEEVDMLWWCIGDWHELLDKPRTETAPGLGMVVSGIELGAMVRELPGPYGAHGILRRLSGTSANTKSSLVAELKSLSQEDARKLLVDVLVEPKPLFPIHAAVQSIAQFGSTTWEVELSKVLPNIATAEMSPFELGIQAFRERALLGNGGVA